MHHSTKVKERSFVFSSWSFLSHELYAKPIAMARAVGKGLWTPFRSKAVNLTTQAIDENGDTGTVPTEKGRGFGQPERKQLLQGGIGVHGEQNFK